MGSWHLLTPAAPAPSFPLPACLLQRLSLATGALSSVLSVVDLLAAHGDAPLPPPLSAATAAYVRALDLQVGCGRGGGRWRHRVKGPPGGRLLLGCGS